jgi:hypothetical protein
MTDEPTLMVFWSITTPMPTGAGGATITNGVTQATSGFGWPKLETTFQAIRAQFDPSVRDTIDDALKLEVWIKIDAMPTMQRERAD